jgi:N utilization substance protein B
MPDVDRAIARIGTFELRFSKEVPKEVAIAEAVNLATDLSTESSPAFINGLLAAVDRLAGT